MCVSRFVSSLSFNVLKNAEGGVKSLIFHYLLVVPAIFLRLHTLVGLRVRVIAISTQPFLKKVMQEMLVSGLKTFYMTKECHGPEMSNNFTFNISLNEYSFIQE